MSTAIYSAEQLLMMYNSYVGKPAYTIWDKNRVNVQGGYDRLDTLAATKGKPGLYGSVIALPCTLGDMELPGEPLISLALSRTIIKTPIDGNDGTFKELYSNGDYQVTIRGVLVSHEDPENYPEDLVRQLRTVVETNKHVAITNALTTLFNIKFVAIEEVNWPDMAGQIGAQYYEIRCTSDKEFALKVREQ